jgi:RNA polymerase sigma-70 factor (ECF subfamily)
VTDPRGTSQASSMDDPFRGFFETHFDYVYRSLRRLGVHDRDLEDVTHDVFLEVHPRMKDYDTSRPPKPWLFAFAFRVASDYRRLARHRIDFSVDVETRSQEHNDAIEVAEERTLARRALEDLDMDRRAVVILHDIDDVPVPEIATTLSIPLNTAYSRLRSGREIFTAAVRRLRARER